MNKQYKNELISYDEIKHEDRKKAKRFLVLCGVSAISFALGIHFNGQARNYVDEVKANRTQVAEVVEQDSTPKASATVTDTKDMYEVKSLEIKGLGTDWKDAEGIITNTSDKTWSYAEVFVKFFDKDNNLLCKQSMNQLNVKPGEDWKFTVNGLNNGNTARIEIDEVQIDY